MLFLISELLGLPVTLFLRKDFTLIILSASVSLHPVILCAISAAVFLIEVVPGLFRFPYTAPRTQHRDKKTVDKNPQKASLEN